MEKNDGLVYALPETMKDLWSFPGTLTKSEIQSITEAVGKTLLSACEDIEQYPDFYHTDSVCVYIQMPNRYIADRMGLVELFRENIGKLAKTFVENFNVRVVNSPAGALYKRNATTLEWGCRIILGTRDSRYTYTNSGSKEFHAVTQLTRIPTEEMANEGFLSPLRSPIPNFDGQTLKP